MKKKLGKESRTEILYARVKPSNKLHIKTHAKNLSRSGIKHSEAMALDSIIEAHKNQTSEVTFDSKAAATKRSNRGTAKPWGILP